MKDKTVETVIDLIRSRSEVGIKKYGTTLSENDLSTAQWLVHSLEEQLDNILYTQRALEEIRKDFDAEEYGVLLKEMYDTKDHFEKRSLVEKLNKINTKFGFKLLPELDFRKIIYSI